MYNSIVPWNGNIGDLPMSLEKGNKERLLLMLRNSFSYIPSNVIIDTRNDTWFNPDIIISSSQTPEYHSERVSNQWSRESVQSEASDLYSHEDARELSQDFPILPSFIDQYDSDLKSEHLQPSLSRKSSEKNNKEEYPFLLMLDL